MSQSIAKWAETEIEEAALGDARLVKRAAAMLAQIFKKKGGSVCSVFTRADALEGAYRFLVNARVTVAAFVRSAAIAALKRLDCAALFFFVLLDFSTLSYNSPTQKRLLGPVGARKQPGSGLLSMTGLAFSHQEVPLGLVSQEFFTRSKRTRRRFCSHCQHLNSARWRKKKRSCWHINEARKKRPLATKETRFWLQAVQHVLALCSELGCKALPWFQCDRGADFWELLQFASEHPERMWMTIRANAARTVSPANQSIRQLLKERSAKYQTTLEIPGGPKRKARVAQLEVKAARVLVQLPKKNYVKLGVVWVSEKGAVPPGEKRLDWLLWTTAPIRTVSQIKAVVRGYKLRWQIEVFHKTWKSVLGVEKSQLESLNGLATWATMLAIVATRIQRLLHRARKDPKLPATEELNTEELQALVLLNVQAGGKRVEAADLTLEQAVEVIARLGGYTGEKRSGGPPGAITLGRGMAELQAVAGALLYLREHGDPEALERLIASLR